MRQGKGHGLESIFMCASPLVAGDGFDGLQAKSKHLFYY